MKSFSLVTILAFLSVLGLTIFLHNHYQGLYQESNQRKIPYTTTEMSMGTLFTVMIAEPIADDKAEALANKALKAIHRLDKKYSTYKSDSLLSKINANAGKPAMKIDKETYDLIHFAKKISALSDGAFDITFHSFRSIWNLRAKPFQIPDKKIIAEKKKWINYKNIILTQEPYTIAITDAHTQIGLGAYVKGYAVDKAAESLYAHNISNFIINGGGDIYFSGTKYGQPWKAGIQHPRKARGELLTTIDSSKNQAIVTSGDYEKFIMYNNQRYHHIIDPRSGYPARTSQSITVIHNSTMEADALATALFILGEAGSAKIRAHFPQAKILFIDNQGIPLGSKELVDKISKTL